MSRLGIKQDLNETKNANLSLSDDSFSTSIENQIEAKHIPYAILPGFLFKFYIFLNFILLYTNEVILT